MSNQSNPTLIRVVKTLLDILYGLLVFSSIALILFIVLSPLIMKVANIPLTASVPVGIGSAESQEIQVTIPGRWSLPKQHMPDLSMFHRPAVKSACTGK